MPSGKIHDAITFLGVAPTFGMLFSRLMFGPDLHIHSKQYVSWGVFLIFAVSVPNVFQPSLLILPI
jgi:uncharacterized metal-binding protein